MKGFILTLITVVLLVIAIHISTYAIDKRLIALDKSPKFCLKTGGLKDGGTTFYYGVGYQIIKWNMISSKTINNKVIHGMEHGYEIHRFPSFVDWEKGPNIELEFRHSNSQ